MPRDRTGNRPSTRVNLDEKTVASFGDEWTHFDQSELSDDERARMFSQYFSIFPWHVVSQGAEGFDMGCGSGRWAMLVAPRVGLLNCIDASKEALGVAKRNMAELDNVRFIHASTDSVPLEEASQDFGYSLGVLHHIPDTAAALKSCTRLLKSGAPFLVYLYYSFDNRPPWFRALWKASDLLRAVISCMPPRLKFLVTDALALTVHWPLACLAWFGEKLQLNTKHLPLNNYRRMSFYTMRTDSRDRFDTPLEKRFTRAEILKMMERAGLADISFPRMNLTGARWAKRPNEQAF